MITVDDLRAANDTGNGVRDLVVATLLSGGTVDVNRAVVEEVPDKGFKTYRPGPVTMITLTAPEKA